MSNLEYLLPSGTLWHPMRLQGKKPSTKEERICGDCGRVFVAYVYHRDAHCESCRANYEAYGKIGRRHG